MKYIKRFIIPLLLLALAVAFQFIDIALIPEEVKESELFRKISVVFIIIAITWIVLALVRLFKRIILANYDLSVTDNLKSRKMHTQFNILERIVVFLIILFAIGATLLTFEGSKNIGISLFASTGLAGIIIGLSAQKVIGTVLAGIQIAITQPVRLDDAVVVEGEWGWIEEIALTYVVVKIWDQRRLILPTTYFIENPFQNWTRTSADILGTVFLYTDYSVPIEEIRKELTRLLEETPLWDKKVNVLQVTETKTDHMELRALMSATDSPTAWDLRVHIREKLVEFLQKNYPGCFPKTRVVIEKNAE